MTHLYEEMVKEFHVTFARPVRETPEVGSPAERVLRVRLMLEELLEFARAAGVRIATGPHSLKMGDLWIGPDSLPESDPNLLQMAHELADLQYVVSGTAVQFGIPLQPCVEEIHSANMCKLGADGKPIVDENGKVRKPEGWRPANVERIVLAHGCTECAGTGVICGECGKQPCLCSPYSSPGAGPCPCGCQSGAKWVDDPAQYHEVFSGSDPAP